MPAACILAYLISQFAPAMRVPFVNEDYAFLDATRGRSLFEVLRLPGLYVGPWIRPWSQGVHYWLLQSNFGLRVEAWHAANLLLGLIVLTSYYTLVRRISSRRHAAVATACAATLVAWGLPMTWIAGAQDLWMLVFAMAMLHAVARGRTYLAAVPLGLALLSKETAAVLPAVAFGWLVLCERQRWL